MKHKYNKLFETVKDLTKFFSNLQVTVQHTICKNVNTNMLVLDQEWAISKKIRYLRATFFKLIRIPSLIFSWEITSKCWIYYSVGGTKGVSGLDLARVPYIAHPCFRRKQFQCNYNQKLIFDSKWHHIKPLATFPRFGVNMLITNRLNSNLETLKCKGVLNTKSPHLNPYVNSIQKVISKHFYR